jgi:hypothetical protein
MNINNLKIWGGSPEVALRRWGLIILHIILNVLHSINNWTEWKHIEKSLSSEFLTGFTLKKWQEEI